MTLSMQQITASNFAYQHLPFDRFLDDAAALGREQVELWGIAPQLHVPQLSDAEARAVRRRVESRGLTVRCLTPEQVMYPVNIASPVTWLRASSVAVFRRAAELCAELGAPLLLLTPGRGFEDEPVEAAWRRSVDAVGEIAAHAAALGVACVLEPLQRVESNLVNDSRTLAAMLDEVGAPNLGAVLDTVGMAAAGESIDDYFDTLGDRIRHVHLIDGRPTGHLAWGDGELPLGDYLAALDRRGYRGAMTFELFGDGGYAFEPRPVVERCLAAVRAALPASG
ncbi:sugar phosphate isomerase/epimerase family protein [Planomonospora venezuelensis]|uniref:Protein FrlC n=1 Tax=Planomonospora venezuelensis TaxID=1999 RepID=A0A841D4W7_PLAVE|nr:TIM barrel protein [Planomonospora venezuelensis]MBB5962496.1 protein FrlC [Planomonospora venezuelensis]GIM99102.1 AP endonuclease [Planomonospora venezuelensis]